MAREATLRTRDSVTRMQGGRVQGEGDGGRGWRAQGTGLAPHGTRTGAQTGELEKPAERNHADPLLRHGDSVLSVMANL